LPCTLGDSQIKIRGAKKLHLDLDLARAFAILAKLPPLNGKLVLMIDFALKIEKRPAS